MATTPLAAPSWADGELKPASRALTVPRDLEPLGLAGFECSLATTSLEHLEEVASVVDGAWLARGASLAEGTLEAALVRTCCRCELVTVLRSGTDLERWTAFLPGGPDRWRPRVGREAVHHLFRVAAGLESIARGEREIRLQLRAAAGSVWSRHRARILRDLMQGAVAAAEASAPCVPSSRSIAALAATRVLELCGRPFPRVVVLGAGTVGRQVTEHLAPSAKVTLVYRQRPPDERFLQLWGVRAVRVEELPAEVALADALVTAAKSGERCLGPRDVPRDRPVVLVDLGVPRNIDPAVRTLPRVRLVDLEQLGSPSGPGPDPTVERSLAEAADRAHARFEAAAFEPWVAGLRRDAESARRKELDLARTFLGPLTDGQEAAVDRLTRRLVDRLLRTPTERLRAVPPGEEGDRLRRWALALLATEPPRP